MYAITFQFQENYYLSKDNKGPVIVQREEW